MGAALPIWAVATRLASRNDPAHGLEKSSALGCGPGGYCNSDLPGRLLGKLHQFIEITAEATAGLKPRCMVGYFDRQAREQ
jgi:hypothetical protein